MLPQPKHTQRAAYRLEQSQRVQAAPTLVATYPDLRMLTVELELYDPRGISRSSQVKYSVNLEHARSVFRFACQNHDCVAGDFDLSEILAAAIAARRTQVGGELCCEGWRDRATIGTLKCRNLLRYKIILRYQSGKS
jgi:hypothetical protein